MVYNKIGRFASKALQAVFEGELDLRVYSLVGIHFFELIAHHPSDLDDCMELLGKVLGILPVNLVVIIVLSFLAQLVAGRLRGWVIFGFNVGVDEADVGLADRRETRRHHVDALLLEAPDVDHAVLEFIGLSDLSHKLFRPIA